MLCRAKQFISLVFISTLYLSFTNIAASPLKGKYETVRGNKVLLKYTSKVDSSGHISKTVHRPAKRSLCLERYEDNELPDYELGEENIGWWEHFKSWEGWDEAWGRVKDVIGATLANVFGGRILERWYALENGETARTLANDKYDRIGKRYNFYFIQYHVVASDTVH